MRIRVGGVIVVVAALFYFATTNAATTCPAGTVEITAANRPIATAAGIPTSSQCWNPNDANVGNEAGAAKQWLQQHASKAANISCLNSQYAEKLKKLMENVPGGVPVITSAYRSPQEQANLPKGSTQVGPCGSYHQYGMAADFNNANKQTLQWMRENASRFGLSPVTGANPTTGCTASGFCDAGHIQNAGPKPPIVQCGVCTSTGSEAYGTVPGIPAPGRGYYDDIPGSYPASPFQNPNTPFMNTPAPVPPAQTPTTASPTTNPPATPTNYPDNYNSNPLPTASSSIFSVPPPYTSPLSTSTNTGGSQTQTAFYKLELLASTSQSTGTSVSTGTSLNGSTSTTLNDDLYNIDSSYSTNTVGTNTQEGTIAVIATNSVAINPIHVSQTFSGANNPPQTASTGLGTAQNKSLIVALLTTLRDLLVSYLNFLKTHPTYGFQGSWQMKR